MRTTSIHSRRFQSVQLLITMNTKVITCLFLFDEYIPVGNLCLTLILSII